MNTHHEHHEPSADAGHEQAHEHEPDIRPRIWIGSLADYNAGRLHGDWVDAAIEPVELRAAAQAILDSSSEPGAEEFAIFDSDEFFYYRVNEYDALDRIAAVARGIQSRGKAFAVWAEYVRSDVTERLDDFEEHYLGHYDSLADWADEVLHDSVLAEELDRAVPDSLRYYVKIDAEAFGRDAQLSGDIYVGEDPNGAVYIFRAY